MHPFGRLHTIGVKDRKASWGVGGESVAVPSDQFQKRTYVKLPYTDAFLRGTDHRRIEAELYRAFLRPLFTIPITQEAERDATNPSARSLGLPAEKTAMYRLASKRAETK